MVKMPKHKEWKMYYESNHKFSSSGLALSFVENLTAPQYHKNKFLAFWGQDNKQYSQGKIVIQNWAA